jgi:hypothetical protein
MAGIPPFEAGQAQFNARTAGFSAEVFTFAPRCYGVGLAHE